MSLIEKLTDTEKEMIGAYIDAYASNETVRTASVDHILRFWDSSKTHLFKMFDNQFIVTKSITFQQDIDELSEEVRKAIRGNRDAINFLEEWRFQFGWHPFSTSKCNYDYLDENIKTELYKMADWGTLASNIWEGETFIVPFKNETSFKVQHGAKITKAMGKIIKGLEMSLDKEFEAFRIACSQGLNQKVLKGNLTLSIHPMDYMTMSDNECDWSSCMSWREGGCYRQGTVEMMNSPMVVVAYLTAEDSNICFNNYKWNSKKWRELLIVTPEMICNVLGYPYRNDNLSIAAITMLKELAEKNCGFTYKNETPIEWYQKETFSPCEGIETYISTETFNMYNDFSDRKHFGFFNDGVNGDYVLYYSGPSECMCCGEKDPELDEEGYLVGNCCVQIEYCAACGERIYDGDGYWIDDMHLCNYCAEENIYTDIYDESHYIDNLREITLMGDNNKTNFESIYVYYTDFNWKHLKKFFTKLYGILRNPWEPLKYYVKVSDLTDAGVELFSHMTGCTSKEELIDTFNSKWLTERNIVTYELCKEFLSDDENNNLWW